jgi:hypothetical protein
MFCLAIMEATLVTGVDGATEGTGIRAIEPTTRVDRSDTSYSFLSTNNMLLGG